MPLAPPYAPGGLPCVDDPTFSYIPADPGDGPAEIWESPSLRERPRHQDACSVDTNGTWLCELGDLFCDLVGSARGANVIKFDSSFISQATNNQKITGLCGPMGDHKRPLWTVQADGRG